MARGWKNCRPASVDENTNRIRQLVRWLVVDAVVVAAIIIGASLELDTISNWAQQQFQLSPNMSTAFVVAAAAIVSAPFWIGMVRVSRVLGFELANRVFPDVSLEKLDMAAAPRKLLVVTLQLAIVLLVGIPLVAITQPFVPTLRGAAVLVFLLDAVGICVLAQCEQSAGTHAGGRPGNGPGDRPANAQGPRDGGRASSRHRAKLDDVNRIITGLGSPVSIELQPGSSAVGRTLAEVKAPRSHRRDDPGDRTRGRIGGGAGRERAAAGRRRAGRRRNAHGGRSGARATRGRGHRPFLQCGRARRYDDLDN